MGTDAEQSSTLKLPLFSVKTPEDAGILTPLHTLASIPFQWEEKPGKPRPCTDIIPLPDSSNIFKCLEPPPRLYNMECTAKNTSTSPSTVLDGPYITNKPKFSSFRFMRDHRQQGSFDSTYSCKSPETGPLILGKKKVESKSWWRRATVKRKAASDENKEINGTSFVFPSAIDSSDCASLSDGCSHSGMNMATLRRSGSFSSLSPAKTHVWAAIYEGFKHVIPWKSKKSKKEVLG